MAVAVFISVWLFVIFIWPTQYRYDLFKRNTSLGTRGELLKINRFTGEVTKEHIKFAAITQHPKPVKPNKPNDLTLKVKKLPKEQQKPQDRYIRLEEVPEEVTLENYNEVIDKIMKNIEEQEKRYEADKKP